MRYGIAILGAGLLAAGAFGQSPGDNSLVFSLDRSGSPPVRYTIRISEGSGKGTFRPELVDAGGAPGQGTGPAVRQQQEWAISVEPATLKKMFGAVPLVKSNRCDAHNRNIAQTGVKRLEYRSSAGSFQCTFNYGLDERVNTATSAFEGVAETIEFGERLRSDLRFDRLGLDAEMDRLESALSDGRALEVGNIVPVLESIQNDEQVMERVRRKAEHLLAVANGTAPQGSLRRDSSDL